MSEEGSRGFSLLELIIVLIVVSLLAVLVTPNLTKTLRHMEVRSSAKRISAILRYCRNEAVNKNRIYQVNFDLESKQVAVLAAQEGEEKLVLQKSYPIPDDIRMEKVDLGKTSFETDHPAFEFYPNGGANGGSAVISDGEGGGYVIQVDFLTGTVKVEATKER